MNPKKWKTASHTKFFNTIPLESNKFFAQRTQNRANKGLWPVPSWSQRSDWTKKICGRYWLRSLCNRHGSKPSSFVRVGIGIRSFATHWDPSSSKIFPTQRPSASSTLSKTAPHRVKRISSLVFQKKFNLKRIDASFVNPFEPAPDTQKEHERTKLNWAKNIVMFVMIFYNQTLVKIRSQQAIAPGATCFD
jgi:hypothetical protein